MMRSLQIVAAAATLLLTALAVRFTATAQTLEEGMRAYRSGDCGMAGRAFRGLAAEGDCRSASEPPCRLTLASLGASIQVGVAWRLPWVGAGLPTGLLKSELGYRGP